MRVINFYGGAGIGKSTIAADIFSKLKRKGHKTELVGEYAKWLWYQNATDIVQDQLYLFAEQVHRLKTLERYGVVVTQDYGVAAMALGKRAYAIHQNGWQYTAENIDRLLMERHMAKKARRSKKKVHLKGPAKRTEADNEKFADGLARLLEMSRNNDGLV